MKKLKTLDLFSGVGGFSLALRDYTLTIAYCDIDPDCQDVLRKRMMEKKQEIPRAPIFSDVKELARYPEMLTTRHGTVDLVVGGFPCQDISVMNHNGTGIFGARSRLFFDALRIAQATQASFLFFENSPNLINRGLDDVKDALRRFGYPRYVCGIFSASDVGAPHIRKRLYILATCQDEKYVARRRSEMFSASDVSSTPPVKSWWKKHPFPLSQARLIPKTRNNMQDLRKRGMMLGNAIVPACARRAFETLLGALAEPTTTQDVIINNPRMFANDTSYAFRMVIPPHKFIYTDETMTPVFEKRQWSTPVRNEWRTSCTCVGSLRATRILPNQIIYDPRSWRSISKEKHTSKACDDWIVNPRFVEWLMGFPRDWTA